MFLALIHSNLLLSLTKHMNPVIIQSIISYVGIPDGDVEVVEDASVITPGLPLPPFFR